VYIDDEWYQNNGKGVFVRSIHAFPGKEGQHIVEALTLTKEGFIQITQKELRPDGTLGNDIGPTVIRNAQGDYITTYDARLNGVERARQLAAQIDFEITTWEIAGLSPSEINQRVNAALGMGLNGVVQYNNKFVPFIFSLDKDGKAVFRPEGLVDPKTGVIGIDCSAFTNFARYLAVGGDKAKLTLPEAVSHDQVGTGFDPKKHATDPMTNYMLRVEATGTVVNLITGPGDPVLILCTANQATSSFSNSSGLR